MKIHETNSLYIFSNCCSSAITERCTPQRKKCGIKCTRTTNSRLLTIYCHSLRLNKTTGFQRWPHNFFSQPHPTRCILRKVVRAKFGHRNVTKVTNRATYFAITLYRWIILLFSRVFSRHFFIDIWPIVIESDNTMKVSLDEFFTGIIQKVIPHLFLFFTFHIR